MTNVPTLRCWFCTATVEMGFLSTLSCVLFESALENELQSKLNLPIVTLRCRLRAEDSRLGLAIVEGCVIGSWSKVGMVYDIEEFRPELKVRILPKHAEVIVLVECIISIEVTWSGQGVALDIASNVGTKTGKTHGRRMRSIAIRSIRSCLWNQRDAICVDILQVAPVVVVDKLASAAAGCEIRRIHGHYVFPENVGAIHEERNRNSGRSA